MNGVDAVPPRPAGSRFVAHLTMAIVAMAIFGAMHTWIGHIQVANGEGYDGADYASMLRGGWDQGGTNTALRPLIVWLAQPAYALTGDVVRAFDFTNYVYVGLLAFLFSRLMERYGASTVTSGVAIACVALSSAFQLGAYYPVAIDLGGHAIMTLALWHIVAGPRWAAAAASVAAVLSREYAPAVMIMGVTRDVRLRVPILKIVATYLPAAIVYVLLRLTVIRLMGEGNSLQTFIANLVLWKDPMWVAFYAYFSLTAIAGVSVVVAAQPWRWWPVIRDEPEWLGLALPIALVTALVGIDIWRYLTALTPLAVVLLARASRTWRPRETQVFLSAIVVLTLVTQTPFQGMNLGRFFVEYFPYYVWLNKSPDGSTPDQLWPGWGWRFLIVTLSVWALTTYASTRERAAVETSGGV
jgi:hypothetical protein